MMTIDGRLTISHNMAVRFDIHCQMLEISIAHVTYNIDF